MKKILLFAFLIFGLVNISFAKESSVKINPAKPHPGDEITITYNPEGTALAGADKIEMRIYPWSNSQEGYYERMSSLEMKKEGSVWTAKFKTSNITDLTALIFINNRSADNNDKLGYFVKIYDNNGNETIGSKIGCALITCDITFGINGLGFKPDFKASIAILDEIFKAVPDQKRKNFEAYIPVFLLSMKDDKANTLPLFEKQVDWFISFNDLTDKEYKMIAINCKRFRMFDKAKEIVQKATVKYPNGETVFADKVESLKIDNTLATAVAQLDKANPARRNSQDYSNLIRKVLEEKKYDLLNDVIKTNKWLLDDSSVCTTLVNNALTINSYPDFMAEVNTRFIEFSKKEFEKPASERENTSSEKQDIERRRRSYGFNLMMSAEVMSCMNQKQNALKIFENAAQIIPPAEMSARYVEWYLKNLIDNNLFEKADPLIETSIKLGKASDKIKDLCKESYVRKHGNEEGYKEYFEKLSSSAKSKNLEELKSRLINKPAPDFTLTDLQGKEVKLSDFKGKIVIVDFWATWCGPCKASFPYMKKVIEKYASNKNIEFVFIDTFERVENPAENAAKFIKENNYPFHVLLDKESVVAKAYGVQGIPSKVFIDKNGNQRLFAPGFNESNIIEEIETMIEMLK
jgi:thiol-disulfide isomerase/thioredoxin